MNFTSLEALAQYIEREAAAVADLSPLGQDEKMKQWGLKHAYLDAARIVRSSVLIKDRGLSDEQRTWLSNCDLALSAAEVSRRSIERFGLSTQEASRVLEQYMQEAYHASAQPEKREQRSA